MLLPLICMATSSFAFDPKIKQQLEKLDPATRLEQACDTEAMRQIGRDKNGFKPDKVIAYTFGDTVPAYDSLKAPGAVFRSKGEWYHLSYHCVTGPEHLSVKSLDYKVGSIVPHEKWDKYYLYN